MRSREVWTHAVDLDNGATFADIPEPVLNGLLRDITGAWKTRGTDTGLLITVNGTSNGTDQMFGDTGTQTHGRHRVPARRGPVGHRPRHPRRHRHSQRGTVDRNTRSLQMDLSR